MINRVLKYYLFQFIYVIPTVYYAYSIGEVGTSFVFFIGLSFIFSTLIYIVDILTTLFLIKIIFKNKTIWSYVIPVFFIIILTPITLRFLDFFG